MPFLKKLITVLNKPYTSIETFSFVTLFLILDYFFFLSDLKENIKSSSLTFKTASESV